MGASPARGKWLGPGPLPGKLRPVAWLAILREGGKVSSPQIIGKTNPWDPVSEDLKRRSWRAGPSPQFQQAPLTSTVVGGVKLQGAFAHQMHSATAGMRRVVRRAAFRGHARRHPSVRMKPPAGGRPVLGERCELASYTAMGGICKGGHLSTRQGPRGGGGPASIRPKSRKNSR